MKSYKAKIRVTARSKRIAASIYHALTPDLPIMPASDNRTSFSLKETEIVFEVQTSDIASLRATVNSYMRLADASYKCLTV